MSQPQTLERIAVLGAGSWGTALAHHLASCGHAVRLWAYEPEVADAVNRTRMNPLFLPGVALHAGIAAAHVHGLAATRCPLEGTIARDLVAAVADVLSDLVHPGGTDVG